MIKLPNYSFVVYIYKNNSNEYTYKLNNKKMSNIISNLIKVMDLIFILDFRIFYLVL